MSKPYGKPDRIVVALGGNALGDTPAEQIEKVNHAAHALLGLIEQGNEIIITHGNGPQVGMIQNAFAAAHDAIGTPSMDLPECGAMSQGYIGYHLQQGIGREMHKRYKRWHAATVVTQIECDPDDPAFKNPTKPIGPFYTEEQAKEFMAEDPSKVFVEDSGRGWRRVVASPDPKKIVEADSILNLLDNEFIVIACGGGLPTRAEAIAALKASGVVFWLNREPAVIYDTVSMAHRPLGQGGKEAFLERFRQREPIYRRWADYIIEGHAQAAEAVGRIAALYERECQA